MLTAQLSWNSVGVLCKTSPELLKDNRSQGELWFLLNLTSLKGYVSSGENACFPTMCWNEQFHFKLTFKMKLQCFIFKKNVKCLFVCLGMWKQQTSSHCGLKCHKRKPFSFQKFQIAVCSFWLKFHRGKKMVFSTLFVLIYVKYLNGLLEALNPLLVMTFLSQRWFMETHENLYSRVDKWSSK